jgi:hypothetical protein
LKRRIRRRTYPDDEREQYNCSAHQHRCRYANSRPPESSPNESRPVPKRRTPSLRLLNMRRVPETHRVESRSIATFLDAGSVPEPRSLALLGTALILIRGSDPRSAPDLSPTLRIASRLTAAPRSRDMSLAASIPCRSQLHGFGQFWRCCSTLQTCFATVVCKPCPPGVYAGRPRCFGFATRHTRRCSSLSRHPGELLTQPGYGFAEHLFLAKCSKVQSFVRRAGHPGF